MFLILLTGMTGNFLHAQQQDARMVEADTIQVDTTYWSHSPRKAAMLSAVLPGTGQIYNRKFWKVPIVYAGLGALAYSAVWNAEGYREYFDKYKYMSETGLEEYEGETIRAVEFYKDQHLRLKNLMIILSVGFYALQIVDANVDAHLMDYDIGNDLSFIVDPVVTGSGLLQAGKVTSFPGSPAIGLKCCLNF